MGGYTIGPLLLALLLASLIGECAGPTMDIERSRHAAIASTARPGFAENPEDKPRDTSVRPKPQPAWNGRLSGSPPAE